MPILDGASSSSSGGISMLEAPSFLTWKSGTYVDQRSAGTSALSSGAVTSGWGMSTPIVCPRACSVDRIGINVTSLGSGTVRLGLYSSDAYGNLTTLLLDAGTVDVSTTGFKEIIISQALNQGVYWTMFFPNVACSVSTIASASQRVAFGSTSSPQSSAPSGYTVNATPPISALPSVAALTATPNTNVVAAVFLRVV